jgi:ribosomal protein L40E
MEGFLALLSGILFSIVLWAVAKDRIDTVRERDAETKRRLTVVSLRRQYIEASDDVPDAWDRFGDALRAADQPDEAIKAWEKAEETAKSRGMFVSTDTGRKIRLAQLDMAQRDRPGAFGMTIHTRDQICGTCSRLSPAQATVCGECGAALRASSFSATTQGAHRTEIISEMIPRLWIWGVLLIAICLATFLPLEVRAVLGIATIAVVPFWWLKKFGEGTN